MEKKNKFLRLIQPSLHQNELIKLEKKTNRRNVRKKCLKNNLNKNQGQAEVILEPKLK